MQITQKPSPNFNERRGGVQPSMLILHYTGMETADEALERLCNPASEVSAHYFIDEDGQVLQLVEDGHRAWHAGVSYWSGETDINSHSIGIELVNPGHEFGYRAFPEAQIEALTRLCQGLIKTHSIAPDMILGHSDVAINRKVDPGHFFPWEKLAGAGVGLWPEMIEMDHEAAEDILRDHSGFHEILCRYGYNPEADFEAVAQAFMRHFQLEKFKSWDDQPEPGIATAARLLALTRQRHETCEKSKKSA